MKKAVKDQMTLFRDENNAPLLFDGHYIRYEWVSELGDWCFSAVDICNALSESQSKDPGAYWRKLKQRLSLEGSEVVTSCHGLKLIAADGKRYKTDCFVTRDVLRLIQSIPSKKAEPFKMWLAQVGADRIDEMIDPEKAITRGVDYYRAKGYTEGWISQRMQGVDVRNELTDEWQQRGVVTNKEYAILTNEMTQACFGLSVAEYKEVKGLKKENLRDNMTNLELVLNMLAEVSTTAISRAKKPETFAANKQVAREGGNVARDARLNIESQIGQSVISPLNARDKKALEIVDAEALVTNEKK